MNRIDPAFFHKLYGEKKPKAVYYDKDFLDYALMIVLTAGVVAISYGPRHVLSVVGLALCAFTLLAFALRHGVSPRVPLILRRPQDVLYLFVYKIRNLKPIYLVALGVLFLENVLIAATPELPHHVGLMRTIGLSVFYVHLGGITIFRTAILIAHLARKEFVREVLMQTPWKRVINGNTNITLELAHAYCTGLLTHIVLIAPWYLVIQYSSFSLIFLPIVGLINVAVHLRWLRDVNAWFYRDHWLGHNSELEFVYLHGPHHDAIPSGMIAVAGNGFLEGFLRFTVGSPVAFYNPVVSFLVFTFDVKTDIELHQYIPGVFPHLPRRALEVGQHSTHHYGRLEPYSLALKVDRPDVSESYRKSLRRIPDELRNSLRLDEELTGFDWDNPTHRLTLSLWDKYQKPRDAAPASLGTAERPESGGSPA